MVVAAIVADQVLANADVLEISLFDRIGYPRESLFASARNALFNTVFHHVAIGIMVSRPWVTAEIAEPNTTACTR